MSVVDIGFTVEAREDGLRLGPFLRGRAVSLSVVRGLKYREDGLLVNGQRARTSLPLAAGDAVLLRLPDDEGLSARPEAFSRTMIVYQSQDALVVEKPAGMATHPDPGHHSGTLANAVSGLYQGQGLCRAFRPVGRLDTDTSGLALCAQNAAAAHLLGQSAQKLYLALAQGALVQEKGVIDAPLGPMPGSSVRQWVCANGRPSQTHYRVLAACQEASLVAVAPKTGRTHQIRAHFAHLGHPLLGDALYGGGTGFLHRHALHCAGIRFTELGGNRPGLYSHLPPDMYAAARLLRLDGGLSNRVEKYNLELYNG